MRKVFEKLRSEDAGMWHVIDASMSLDDVTSRVFCSLALCCICLCSAYVLSVLTWSDVNQITQIAECVIERAQGLPLQKLWDGGNGGNGG